MHGSARCQGKALTATSASRAETSIPQTASIGIRLTPSASGRRRGCQLRRNGNSLLEDQRADGIHGEKSIPPIGTAILVPVCSFAVDSRVRLQHIHGETLRWV